MKILFLNPVGVIGGAEKSLLDILGGLDRVKYRPLVACFSGGPLVGSLEAMGVEAAVVPLPSSVFRMSRGLPCRTLLALPLAPFVLIPFLGRLLRLARTEEVDIIHTNGIKAHLVGIPLSLLSGARLVWHFRDDVQGPLLRGLFRFLGRAFPSRIIANSRRVGRIFDPSRKLRVIYNGIDVSLYYPEDRGLGIREEFGVPAGALLVGTVGHFAPIKGYDDFLRMAAGVRKRLPGTKFCIVGDEIYAAHKGHKAEIEAVADRLGLRDDCFFPGFRDDIPSFLQAFDIFVLTSRTEGFGRTNLEAMAAGRPVVSTAAGGVPEVVEDGETGLLVPAGDQQALTAAVMRLAGDELLRRRMGKAGRKRAATRFSLQEHVRRIENVYDESS